MNIEQLLTAFYEEQLKNGEDAYEALDAEDPAFQYWLTQNDMEVTV